MLRSCHSICVLAELVLCAWLGSACFGKVEYDQLAEDGAAAGGARGGVTPAQSTGGLSGSGGAVPPEEPPSRPPLEEPLPTLEPPCSSDCCPDRLTQLTGVLGASLDDDVERPYLSANGAWVVFSSRATNVVSEGASGQREVFVHSLTSGVTTSIRAGNVVPSGDSEASAVSADGRHVLITSSADNWALGDDNGASDVFLYDRASSELLLISRAPHGASGNGASLARDLSPDGRFVVYSSRASDLTAGDDNDAWDVFVWDRADAATERISMGPGDQQTNPVSGNHAHISVDGRYVSFHSQSDALALGEANGTFDIFLADRELGTTVRVSRAWSGGAANGNTFVLGMSDDARFLSSYGSADNLVPADTNGENDVFLFDRELRTTTRVNVGPEGQEAESGSTSVAMSSDGRWLSFASAAAQLAFAGDGVIPQSYIYAAEAGRLARVSESAFGEPGNARSYAAELSKSGRCFVFASHASNLTRESKGDGVADLFVGRSPFDAR